MSQVAVVLLLDSVLARQLPTQLLTAVNSSAVEMVPSPFGSSAARGAGRRGATISMGTVVVLPLPTGGVSLSLELFVVVVVGVGDEDGDGEGCGEGEAHPKVS